MRKQRVDLKGANETAPHPLFRRQRCDVIAAKKNAAGVPRGESRELFAAIAGLSRDITVLFIEHDMDLVFRFASRVIVMVGGRVLVEGTPAEIAADPQVRAVYLGKARHGAAP